MGDATKVFCKDCSRYYHSTSANQCDIRAVALEPAYSGLHVHAKFSDWLGKEYGHPLPLNKDNDCPFFKQKPIKRHLFGWLK